MKDLAKYLLCCVLTIGIFFLTTDCKIYTGETGHHFFTHSSQADRSDNIEHTHVPHHVVNDIFSEIIMDDISRESIILIKTPKPFPSLINNNFTVIWQPPKLS